MSIYKIGRIGTKDIAIEEADDERAACFKAGWSPEWCRVEDITAEVMELKKNGELEVVK